jgi:hypothetical protein
MGSSTLHGYINKVSIESINNTSGNNNGYGNIGPTKINVYNQLGQRVVVAQPFVTEGANSFPSKRQTSPRVCIYWK